ncbi:MAG: hypothetical protein WBZ14_21495 [Terriglobales bacterium]
MSSSSNKPSVKLCEQRKTNGDPCQSPALHGKRFCHFHEITGPPPINIDNADTIPSDHIYLPRLEDAASIQSAISDVCEMMLHRRIEPKEACALFYAMQVASTNMAFLNANRNQMLSSETSSVRSSDPRLLPPGTIQACEQPKRRNRRRRA